MPRLNYCTVAVADFDRARGFYDALLESIGWGVAMELPERGVIYGDGVSMLGVMTPFDGQPAVAGNGTMFGFCFDSSDDVRAFHAKALELGGRTEGDPGPRGPGAYFAYFRDSEGNKLCAYALGA